MPAETILTGWSHSLRIGLTVLPRWSIVTRLHELMTDIVPVAIPDQAKAQGGFPYRATITGQS